MECAKVNTADQVNTPTNRQRPERKIMATATRSRRAKAQPEPEIEETNGAVREPTELHELMADYFNETYDAGVTPYQCAIFTSKRTEFRKSDAYQEYRERRGEVADEKAAAKTERANTRAAKAEAATEPAKKAPARRGRKAAAETEEAVEEPKKAPARRSRRSGTSETEEAKPKAASPRRRRSAPQAAEQEEPF